MTTAAEFAAANEALVAEYRAEAEEILSRAEGGEIVGADAERFDVLAAKIEDAQKRIDVNREMDARDRELAGVEPRFARLIAASYGGAPPAGGRIPAVAVDCDEIRQAHAAVVAGQAAQIETRAVTVADLAPPAEKVLPPWDFGRERTRIGALMPGRQVGTPTATYYRQTAAAAGATPVAEGADKPESSPGWEPVDVPIRKLAHWVDVTKEALDDVDGFTQIVQTEMIRGLIDTENVQVLDGAGTGQNMTGLLKVAGILTHAPGSVEAPYLSVLAAVTKLRTGAAFADADVVVVHPADWQTIVSTATTTGDLVVNRDPSGAGPATLWGVPVVLSTGVAAGTAVVAALADSATMLWRETPTILVDPYSQSSKNLVRFVCEERVAVAVPRPAGVCKVTFKTS